MAKPIVLVDEKDNVLGFKEKFATHKIPVPLHRAISIVVFDKSRTKMLITRRATSKPTWGGFWSNAVCTHPYPDENYKEAAQRRIIEELGFDTPLNEIFYFKYCADMEDGNYGEHELDHVFSGSHEGLIKPNSDEIESYELVEIGKLKKDVAKDPKKYTPWFKIILEKI